MRTQLPLIFSLALLTGCFHFDSSGLLRGPAGTYTLDVEALEAALQEMAEAELRLSRQ
jgi:hypothetical protein